MLFRSSLSDATPQPLGTAASGDDATAARADHVHDLPSAAQVGALDSNSIVDGGEYVGVIITPGPSITITQQPANQTGSGTTTWSATNDTTVPGNCSSLLYNGTTVFGVRASTGGAVSVFKRSGGSWTTQQLSSVYTALSYIAATSSRILVMPRKDSAHSPRSYYSDNGGSTWAASASAPEIVSLAASPDRFVALPTPVNNALGNAPKLLSSASGTSWSQLTETSLGNNFVNNALVLTEDYYAVAYGGGRFIAVGEADTSPQTYDNSYSYRSPYAAYSADGLAWTAVSLPGTQAYTAVGYGDGKWVAVCNGFRSYRYYNGTNFQGHCFGGKHLSSVMSGTSFSFYGHLSNSIPGSRRVAISTDNGATWTAYENAMPFTDQGNSITYANGHFVAVGTNVDACATSTNGITWTARTISATRTLGLYDGIAWDGESFYAGGDGREKITPTTTGIGATFSVTA